MPMFGSDSFSKLSTCHRDLQVIFFEVIKSFDCKILDGHRDQAQQDHDYANGYSKLKWPDGKHNSIPSNAVDVAPYPLEWKNIQRFYWFAGFVMGIAKKLKDEGKVDHSIRFGGDWNKNYNIDDESFKDLTHFELI